MTEALEGGRASAQAVEIRPPHRRVSRAVFVTAVGIGLVAGWLELATVMVERSIDPRISMDSLRTNRHFFWMIPLGDVLLFTTLGLLVAMLARVQPGIVHRLSCRLFACLALLAVLLAVESLHVAASVALACGLGYQFGPWLERRAHRFRRLALVAPPALAAGLAVLACVGYSRVVTEERRLQAGRIPALPDAPNLLWIVLDNVRADSMSLHGHDRPTTPNLERLARKAACFTQARRLRPGRCHLMRPCLLASYLRVCPWVGIVRLTTRSPRSPSIWPPTAMPPRGSWATPITAIPATASDAASIATKITMKT